MFYRLWWLNNTSHFLRPHKRFLSSVLNYRCEEPGSKFPWPCWCLTNTNLLFVIFIKIPPPFWCPSHFISLHFFPLGAWNRVLFWIIRPYRIVKPPHQNTFGFKWRWLPLLFPPWWLMNFLRDDAYGVVDCPASFRLHVFLVGEQDQQFQCQRCINSFNPLLLRGWLQLIWAYTIVAVKKQQIFAICHRYLLYVFTLPRVGGGLKSSTGTDNQ